MQKYKCASRQSESESPLFNPQFYWAQHDYWNAQNKYTNIYTNTQIYKYANTNTNTDTQVQKRLQMQMTNISVQVANQNQNLPFSTPPNCAQFGPFVVADAAKFGCFFTS